MVAMKPMNRHDVTVLFICQHFTASNVLGFVFQVESEFILESERESFIEQVREVIEMADEKGEGIKEGFPQVLIYYSSYY